MSGKTINALLSRGIDSTLAQNLANLGYTLQKMKMMTEDELIDKGLSEDQVHKLFLEKRPPIPPSILNRVMYKNKHTCCICRDSSKPIILHHIIEWSESRDHSEENLAVLCLDHHDEAHTKRDLSLTLTADRVRGYKRSWEEDCEKQDIIELYHLKYSSESSSWAWINIPRLFEIFLKKKLEIIPSDLNKVTYEILRDKGFLDQNNILIDEEEWPVKRPSTDFYYLDFWDGKYIADYLATVLEVTLRRLPIIDITENLKQKGWLKSMIKDGSFIALQADFYFKDVDKIEDNKKKNKKAYYRGHGIKIEYSFNPWFCLSSSARHCWMSGHTKQTIVGRVRSIIEEEGELVINISCIASGSYFATHPARVFRM
ncbi:hypothetical protein GCM10007161_13440 [Ignatzschineria indica]|uniref:HNH nuclease domain-containing protein n=1 Tax=Ignatzschineria indica TaxID=472583 RepID=A0A2U2AJU4_9GAMM|nr:HNH endonuclease signature motif containing protein [Ignatzschineria indica]PWD83060.1 hypothetical protein DC082_06440 [Ignatzschineria indica]GGZ83268.1 hypothetical protein GCM10007161_13440 [Ignatzschineria indica]